MSTLYLDINLQSCVRWWCDFTILRCVNDFFFYLVRPEKSYYMVKYAYASMQYACKIIYDATARTKTSF